MRDLCDSRGRLASSSRGAWRIGWFGCRNSRLRDQPTQESNIACDPILSFFQLSCHNAAEAIRFRLTVVPQTQCANRPACANCSRCVCCQAAVLCKQASKALSNRTKRTGKLGMRSPKSCKRKSRTNRSEADSSTKQNLVGIPTHTQPLPQSVLPLRSPGTRSHTVIDLTLDVQKQSYRLRILTSSLFSVCRTTASDARSWGSMNRLASGDSGASKRA